MDANYFIKLHRAEGNAAEETAIKRLVAEDARAQAGQRAALIAQRAVDGHVSAICPKCGAESVFDAKNKSAKCGAMTGVVPVKDADGNKHNVPAACGKALAA